MTKAHDFSAAISWTGNRGDGTKTYKGYDRSWRIETPGKPIVECSNDPQLGGDASKPNPEDLLLASLSACHMLWFLHLASNAGLVIHQYEDSPLGHGETGDRGEGRFVGATLRPHITLERADDAAAIADKLHHDVHKFCFISRSVNFPVQYAATYSEI